MGLNVFRRWSRVIATVLLCAAAGLPHIAADDAACVPAAIPGFGEHDESQHGFRAGSANDTEHCGICHWNRSLRSQRASLILASGPARPPDVVFRPGEARVESASLDHLPARAPPTALL